MAPILYMLKPSPPVRAVLMCAKAVNVDLELKTINLLAGEHLTPEYLKINPQHTVPTLDDDGFIISDSHVIMSYLISKYGKNDDLYPKEVKARAVVDHRLHFDSGVLFPRLLAIVYGNIFHGEKYIDEGKKQAVIEAYGFLECYLEGKKYIAGDSLTIADFSVITTLSTIAFLVPIKVAKFPKLTKYMIGMEALPIHEVNQDGLEAFTEITIMLSHFQ